MPFFMFSHSAEEHYFLQHSITNITVINNSKQHEPLLRAPVKAQSLHPILAHLTQMLQIF